MCKKEKKSKTSYFSKMNTHHQLYIYEAWVYPPGLKNKAN